jgi:AraC family transcriptional regulator, regulatory protein of adaptative response / methylated-DNA-[protein]-cysteine methyltransferase
MNDDEFWQAVISRDKGYDRSFVFAVRTTGIYCKPSCPARRPKQENVTYYTSADLAEAAGFRPCRRCQPDRTVPLEPQLELVQRVCEYLSEATEQVPTLESLAARFHLSSFHLQRTFKRLVGVTPRQYASAQRLERLKNGLQRGLPVSDAQYAAGYGSSSALYTRAVAQLGMTPGAYGRGGTAVIKYHTVSSPLGWLLLAATEHGLCAVKLGDAPEPLVQDLRREFPQAELKPEAERFQPWTAEVLDYLRGNPSHLELPLDIRATAFQMRVWQALRTIPSGSTRTYSQVAAMIGQPTAVRAVANACASNPVALVVPCHRVIRTDGGLGGYRWGIERKRRLLEQEAQDEGVSASIISAQL